jgi:hypothetical protein
MTRSLIMLRLLWCQKLGQVPLLLQYLHPLLSLRNLTQAAVAEALRAINHVSFSPNKFVFGLTKHLS